MTENTPQHRDARGRLTAGNRASPGRPSGSSERDQIRKLAEPHRGLAVQALVDVINAKENPAAVVKAAQELLDRLAARPRAQAERVQIPGLKDAVSLEDKCKAVVAAVADGQISVDAGRAALGMLADVARVLQVSDLEARIRRLEGKPARTIDAKPDDGSDLA